MADHELKGLGQTLENQRTPEKLKIWRLVVLVVLAVMLILNFVIENPAPHFVVDKYPGFWPLFGLVVGVAMVFFVKKIVQPLIKRAEDFYGDL